MLPLLFVRVVVICGMTWGAEGKDVGEWLQRNGISAFVLHYRTAGVGAFMTPYRYVFRGNRYPDALNDLQRAMQYVKAHAQKWALMPHVWQQWLLGWWSSGDVGS